MPMTKSLKKSWGNLRSNTKFRISWPGFRSSRSTIRTISNPPKLRRLWVQKIAKISKRSSSFCSSTIWKKLDLLIASHQRELKGHALRDTLRDSKDSFPLQMVLQNDFLYIISFNSDIINVPNSLRER